MSSATEFQLSSLSDDDLKEFEAPSFEETVQKEKESDNPIEKEPPVKKKEVSPEQNITSFIEEGEESSEEAAKETEKQAKPEKKEAAALDEGAVLDLQAVYQSYVDKGIWVAVTDSEGNEIQIEDEETFEKLMDWQAKNAANLALAEREQEYGEKYQLMIHHLKNGGRMEDLASSFQESTDLESLDENDISDAETIIRSYYESLDWEKSEINDQIETLKDRGDESFKSFASKRKADLARSIKANREEMMREQEIQAKRIRDYQEAFNRELRKEIYSLELPDREKKDLDKFYYEKKNPVNGGKASDFYIEFEKIKQDPKELIKLIRYVKNRDNFEEKAETEKKVKLSIFKRAQEGETMIKKGTQLPEAEKAEKGKRPTTFDKFK